MATHLKGTSTTPITPQITRWKIAAISTVSLALLFLGLSSQFLLFERPGSHHTHSSQKLHSTQEVLDVGSRHDRPLVAYAYAESNNARENLKFFLKRGLHAGADFIFIFNGETNASELVPAHLANVKIVKRDNTCYDMGAFGEVLSKDRLWMKYKRFITLNASIRGPFLPIWSNECWTDAFLSKVTDKIKLVGLTYNCIPNPHVQSMLLATDSVGMQILLDPALAHTVPLNTPPWGGLDDPVGYSVCYQSYEQAVHSEIGIARLIRSRGYEVDVMLTSVHSLSPAEYCHKLGPINDHLVNGGYFGSNVHPYELIFAKANRGIDDSLMEHLTSWHYNMNETSWDKCGARMG